MFFPEIESIKQKRQKLNLTQKELAKITRVSQSLIAKLEKGAIEPSYSIIKKIFIELNNLENKNQKKCFEIMTTKVITINFSQKISKAIELMKQYNISQIPVKKNNQIIGVIYENTILSKLNDKKDYSELINLKVGDIIKESLPTVDKNTLVINIIPIIKETSAILITDKNKIKGIISKSDLL